MEVYVAMKKGSTFGHELKAFGEQGPAVSWCMEGVDAERRHWKLPEAAIEIVNEGPRWTASVGEDFRAEVTRHQVPARFAADVAIMGLHGNQRNHSHGFWDDGETPTALAAKIALMHSELSELLEAVRKDPGAPCDKPIPLSCEEEELADVLLRLTDYAHQRGIDLGRAAKVKFQYNKTREHKHGKAI